MFHYNFLLYQLPISKGHWRSKSCIPFSQKHISLAIKWSWMDPKPNLFSQMFTNISEKWQFPTPPHSPLSFQANHAFFISMRDHNTVATMLKNDQVVSYLQAAFSTSQTCRKASSVRLLSNQRENIWNSGNYISRWTELLSGKKMSNWKALLLVFTTSHLAYYLDGFPCSQGWSSSWRGERKLA